MPQDRAHRPDLEGGGDPSGAASSGSMPEARAGTYFLGRYRVVDEIGIGGMASVHLGRMDGPGGFQKWVAIKRIHSHLVEDDTFIHMFLDEARVAARISHPNVATVFELGKHEDTYWIAMEYLHGEPLREVMRRTEEIGQPMPPEIACRVIADAAEGLHAAHELLGKNGEKLQLVHRDVTPHNLFVTYDGTTKVVDFGIAKFSSRMSNTRAGTLKGKLAYMSPEQVHGEGIDRRTDIFALGVVLWELTTGQRLFRMDSDLDTLAKVQECNVPRPSTVIRGYPIDLEKIVMKALSKNRGERFKTAREFSRALQSLLMRRGLFIASDEVASYVQAIFQDRIRKREAHLRWAADVTQTINLDGMLAPTPPPISGGHAAGEGSVVTFNSEVQPSPQQARHGVRPAAGMPAAPASRPSGAPAASSTTNPRPGAVRTADTVRPPAKGGNAPRKSAVPPPPDSDPSSDEAPTIQASPQARAALLEANARENANAFDQLDDFDDNDDTIVTTTRIDGGAPRTPPPAAGNPPMFPLPARAAQENVAFAAPPRSVPARAAAPAPLPPVVVSSTGQMPITEPRKSGHVDALLAEALAESRGAAPASQRPMSEAIDEALRVPRFNLPTIPRLFAPPLPSEMRTETARVFRKPPPMWLVAVGSGALALIIAAVVIAIVSSSRSAPTATPAPSGSTSGTGALPSATGVFSAARAAFTAAIAAPSLSPASPPPMPPPTSMTPSPAPTATLASATLPSAAAAASSVIVAGTAPRLAPGKRGTAAATIGTGTGTLTVICFPACDQVLDNGTPLGASPIFKRTVGVGEHRLKLISSNPPSQKVVSVIVMADEAKTVRQPMTP